MAIGVAVAQPILGGSLGIALLSSIAAVFGSDYDGIKAPHQSMCSLSLSKPPACMPRALEAMESAHPRGLSRGCRGLREELGRQYRREPCEAARKAAWVEAGMIAISLFRWSGVCS